MDHPVSQVPSHLQARSRLVNDLLNKCVNPGWHCGSAFMKQYCLICVLLGRGNFPLCASFVIVAELKIKLMIK